MSSFRITVWPEALTALPYVMLGVVVTVPNTMSRYRSGAGPGGVRYGNAGCVVVVVDVLVVVDVDRRAPWGVGLATLNRIVVVVTSPVATPPLYESPPP